MKRSRRKYARISEFRTGLYVFGLLLSIMFSLMCTGGGLNLEQFSDNGNVRDFSQTEIERFGKKQKVSGKEQNWNYLLLHLKLSDSQGGKILYFSGEGKKVAEQQAVFFDGRNMIELPEEILLSYIKIIFDEQETEPSAVEQMQLRMKETVFSPGKFLLYLVVFFLVFCTILWFWPRAAKRAGAFHQYIENVITIPQYGYKLIGEPFASRAHRKIRNQKLLRISLYAVLFAGLIISDISDDSIKKDFYPYSLLGSALLLLLIGILSWDKKGKRMKWDWQIGGSWFFLWGMAAVSNILLPSDYKNVGLLMLGAGGFLIYAWNHMIKPNDMLNDMRTALIIVFYMGLAFCIMFRPLRDGVLYNGIYRDPAQSAMFYALMTAVFLERIFSSLQTSGKGRPKLCYFGGLGAACCLLLLTGNISGLIAVLMNLFLICAGIRKMGIRRRNRKYLFFGIPVAVLCAFAVWAGVGFLPEFLNTDFVYTDERYIVREARPADTQLKPLEPAEDLIFSCAADKKQYRNNYFLETGLWGKNEPVKVYGKTVSAYNAYLELAYWCGFFALLPYVVLQITAVQRGLRSFRNPGLRGDTVFMFMVTLSFLCFCLRENVENGTIHPLWLCYYIGLGLYFQKPLE